MNGVKGTRGGQGGGGWERCRKEACCKVRAERDDLRRELQNAQRELRGLETGLRLGGEARGWRASLVAAEQELERERKEHEATRWRRNQSAADLRAAEKEGTKLRTEIAALKAELSLLRTKVVRQMTAEYERVKLLQQLRQLEREKKKQKKLAESADEQAEEAKRRLQDIAVRMARTRTMANRELTHERKQAAKAKELVDEAQFEARQAQSAAEDARKRLMEEEEALKEAEKARDDADWAAKLADLRAKRARAETSKLKEKLDAVAPPVKSRTVDEWAKLSHDARRKAAQREREHLASFFASHKWRAQDIAAVLESLGWVADVAETRPFYDVLFHKVRELMTQLEKEHYGMTFALFLHYDLHLTLPKILSISQAASKRYVAVDDRYVASEPCCTSAHGGFQRRA